MKNKTITIIKSIIGPSQTSMTFIESGIPTSALLGSHYEIKYINNTYNPGIEKLNKMGYQYSTKPEINVHHTSTTLLSDWTSLAEKMHWIKTPTTEAQVEHITLMFLHIAGWLFISYAILIFLHELVNTLKLIREKETDIYFTKVKKAEQKAWFWLLIATRVLLLNLAVPFFILIMGLDMLHAAGVAHLALFASTGLSTSVLLGLGPVVMILYMTWRLVGVWMETDANGKSKPMGEKILKTTIMMLIMMAMMASLYTAFLPILLGGLVIILLGVMIKLWHEKYKLENKIIQSQTLVLLAIIALITAVALTLTLFYFFAPALLTVALSMFTFQVAAVFLIILALGVYLGYKVYQRITQMTKEENKNHDVSSARKITAITLFAVSLVLFIATLLTITAFYFFAPALLTVALSIGLIVLGVAVACYALSELFLGKPFNLFYALVALLAAGFITSGILMLVSVSIAPLLAIVATMLLVGVILGWLGEKVLRATIPSPKQEFMVQPRTGQPDSSAGGYDKNNISKMAFVMPVVLTLVAGAAIGFTLFAFLPHLFIAAVVAMSVGLVAYVGYAAYQYYTNNNGSKEVSQDISDSRKYSYSSNIAVDCNDDKQPQESIIITKKQKDGLVAELGKLHEKAGTLNLPRNSSTQATSVTAAQIKTLKENMEKDKNSQYTLQPQDRQLLNILVGRKTPVVSHGLMSVSSDRENNSISNILSDQIDDDPIAKILDILTEIDNSQNNNNNNHSIIP